MRTKLRYFFTVLVSIYFLNSIGMPVYFHYCCGELESVSALFKDNTCCGEEEEEDEDSDCCQDETQLVSQKSESPFYAADYKLIPLVTQLSFLQQPSICHLAPHYSIHSFSGDKFEFQPGNGRTVLQKISVLII